MNRALLLFAVVLVVAAAIVAWQAWAAITPQRAFDDFTELLDGPQSPRPKELVELFEAFHDAGPEELRRIIRANLDSKDDDRRAAALYLVGSWRVIIDDWDTAPHAATAPKTKVAAAAEFTPEIAAALTAEDPKLRRAGLEAFAALPAPPAVLDETVRAMTEHEPDPELRKAALIIYARAASH